MVKGEVEKVLTSSEGKLCRRPQYCCGSASSAHASESLRTAYQRAAGARPALGPLEARAISRAWAIGLE